MRAFWWGMVGFQALVVAAFILGVVYFGPDILHGVVDRIDHAIGYSG